MEGCFPSCCDYYLRVEPVSRRDSLSDSQPQPQRLHRGLSLPPIETLYNDQMDSVSD